MPTRRPDRRETRAGRTRGRGARPGAALAAVALILACAGVTGWAGQRAGAAWNFLAAETLTERMYEAREFTPAGLEAATVIYVGDSSRDIQAGHAAGMVTIAAAYGYITPDDDAAAWGADIIARDTEELAQLVLKAVNLGP